MIKVSWETSSLGTLHAVVKEAEAVTLLESLAKLGLEAEVEMVES